VGWTRAARTPAPHQAFVYDDELELIRTIGEFSMEALGCGGAVILLARRDHLESVDEWVRLSGALLPRAGSPPIDGRFQTIDIDEIICDLELVPDPSGELERLLRAACDRIPPECGVLHVFGHLVGSLWERGQSQLSLEIELIGSRLAAERDVSVLCAYPARALGGRRDLESIRRCHTRVVPHSTVPSQTAARSHVSDRSVADGSEEDGPPRVAAAHTSVAQTKVFPASMPACRAARHFVRRTVQLAGNSDEMADAAELVCSELAANAVRHARSVFTVRVVCGDDGACVSVANECTPTGLGPGGAPEHFPVRVARGLGIVSALSSNWGVDDYDSGKVVWAELRPPRDAA
jgi:anti-sigma regulatory factor (Ser/Thr protein kinase)